MIRALEEQDKKIINEILKNKSYQIENDPYINGYVFIDNDSLIAFLIYSKIYERAELNYIYVLPNFRNKKVASKLMEMFLTENVENYTLEVNENNLPAINLYKKYGFKQCTIRKKYYGNDDAIMMIKEVTK
jgi:ribosomal-protein-alanine N-acetyltransferase